MRALKRAGDMSSTTNGGASAAARVADERSQPWPVERGTRVGLAGGGYIAVADNVGDGVAPSERYREPRPGSVPDLARGTLRVLRDGGRVGVDAATLRRAQHGYRQLWEALEPAQRECLDDPDSLPFP